MESVQQPQQLPNQTEDQECQLSRSSRNLEKLRRENRVKVETINGLESQVRLLEDKVRYVESRPIEAEKRELKAELLKSRLDSSISECREKERELKSSQQELEDTQNKLEKAGVKIDDLSDRVLDLKEQVREELLKNEDMEQKLDELEMLKDDVKIKDRKLAELKAEVDHKTMILEHARLSLRQEKEKVKDLKGRVDDGDRLREDLALSQAESLTLKRLLIGKDSLLVQRSQALHLAKKLIRELDPKGTSASTLELIDQPNALYPQGVNFRDPDKRRCLKDGSMADFEKMQKYLAAPGGKSRKKLQGPVSSASCMNFGEQDEQNGLLETILQDDAPPSTQEDQTRNQTHGNQNHNMSYNMEDSSRRAKTAVTRSQFFNPSQTFSNFRGGKTYSTESLLGRPENHRTNKGHSKTKYSEIRSVSFNGQPRTKSGVSSSVLCENSKNKISRPGSARSTGHLDQNSTGGEMNVYELDQMYMKFVHLGDRVITILPSKKGKDQLCKGTVRYIGEVDKEVDDFRMYIGVKLDEPMGDTDGLYKGKRYFSCSEKNGRIMRITRVKAVLSQKSSTFTPIQECIDNYIKLGAMNHSSTLSLKSR